MKPDNTSSYFCSIRNQEDEFRKFRSQAMTLSNDFNEYKSSGHEERANLEKRILQQDSALDALIGDAKDLCAELDNILPL